MDDPLPETLRIRTLGDPVLRVPGRPVADHEIRTSKIQTLIGRMIETMRAAQGAGLAAPQVGESLRIAIAEVRPGNRRYPYKPELPLTVMINPTLEPIGTETVMINEGCLSMPNLRGEVERHLRIRLRYRDRDGVEHVETHAGLTAGTFQHELDHLEGILVVDRADPRSLMLWDQFERHHQEEFLRRAAEIERRAAA